MLVLTALVTAAMVLLRVSSDTDQESLQESLDAIALHSGLYGASGGARLLSGIALIVTAWFLLRTWIIRQRVASPWVPGLLMASGFFTAVAGLSSIVLAVAGPEINTLVEFSNLTRWLTAKTGFALAGLALVVAARFQWQVGFPLRLIAPVSAVLGAAMQFIWIDSATLAHPIIGAGFFFWLVAVGTMLATGRTERLFVRVIGSGSSRPG